jgi:glucose/arabinose dehydrogenase
MKQIFLLVFFVVWLCLPKPVKAQNDYYQEDRWPNLKFIYPVAMHTAPDNSKRIFVIEQTGRIKVFKDSGTVGANDTTTFLNLRNRIGNSSGGSETGLLGMAFHPNFSQNGYVFVNYTSLNPTETYVSRFKLDSLNPNRLLQSSEKRILRVAQPFSNHNAGSLLFGDDGYLYITMGDGGSGGDPGNRAQNRSELLGKMLRIDVNVPENGPPYTIPADNPLVNNIQNWKKEIYAWGLRNPWKITKDPNQTTMWIGDVGQGAFEEIDTLRKGANYGWKVTEGNAAYSQCGSCDTSNYEKPLATYGRNLGISVTGGYVYRGTELFKLKGAYIYADYSSQRVWKLQKENSPVYQNVLVNIGPNLGAISSFGLDNDKELYTVRYSAAAGKLYKLRCGPPTPTLAMPLKPTICIGDSLVFTGPTASNVVGYKWSTGDTTRRIVIRNEGVYNLSLQTRNAFGCWSYVSQPLRLRINPLPSKPIIPNLTVCERDSAEVSLPGSLIYSWSSNGSQNVFSSPTGGQYWVLTSDSAGCKSDTSFFQVNVNASPTVPVITINGNELSAASTGAASYEWFRDGILVETTTVPTLNNVAEGVYNVVSISSADCRSLISLPVTFVSTEKMTRGEPAFSLLPNPVKDEMLFSFNSNKTNQTIDLEIFDIKGVSVLKQNLKSNAKQSEFKINVKALPKGTYTARISVEGKKMTQRILKD